LNLAKRLAIKIHFRRAVNAGWVDHFKNAAAGFGFPVEVLMAIASRETNMRNIVGDVRNGLPHGYGLMQVDIGSFPNWCKSGAWKDPAQSILKGTEILAGKRNWLANNVGQSRGITDSRGIRVRYLAPLVADADELRVVIAMYNGGEWPVYKYATNRDPDSSTTGRDYSKDVLERSEVFKSLL
jgi:hypothetical protein